jgi:cysteine desulfurase
MSVTLGMLWGTRVYFFTRRTYLDHNATTPVAREVRRAMEKCLRKVHGNASSLHTAGRRARGIIDAARKSVAEPLGCEPEQIIFTSGGTEANNAVIKGVFDEADVSLGTGPAGSTTSSGRRGHIVTSKIEHESVIGACEQVEARGGEVTYLPAGPDGRVEPDEVGRAIRPETILVSIMHANNETGVIQPVKEIAAVCEERGVPLHTDAVQTYGKIPTPVDELGCEFLSLSAHKINGPKGVGALYWRGKTKWTPHSYGGSQERGLRAGTEGVHQIAGLGKAAELRGRKVEKESARLAGLRERVVAGIRKLYPEVMINECPGHQLPGTVNATFPGKDGLRLLAGLDCWEVCVSIGSACTADRIEPSHVLLGMGRSEEEALSTIRISMGTTTGPGHVSFFLWALGKALEGDPEGFSYLDPQELTEERILSDDTFLIDVRSPIERMLTPSIPGAKLWNHIGFERYMRRIPRDKEVILMCNTGVLSSTAGYHLANAGHKRVRVIFGGYQAWWALFPGLTERLKARWP